MHLFDQNTSQHLSWYQMISKFSFCLQSLLSPIEMSGRSKKLYSFLQIQCCYYCQFPGGFLSKTGLQPPMVKLWPFLSTHDCGIVVRKADKLCFRKWKRSHWSIVWAGMQYSDNVRVSEFFGLLGAQWSSSFVRILLPLVWTGALIGCQK